MGDGRAVIGCKDEEDSFQIFGTGGSRGRRACSLRPLRLSTPVRNYGDVFWGRRSGGRSQSLGFKLVHKDNEVLPGESPLERGGEPFVALLEGQECILKLSERTEFIWRQHLALNDREVDLNLIEPTRVDGRVHRNDRRPSSLQTLHTFLSAVRGAIVDNPEHAVGRPIRLLAHHLFN